MMSSSQKKRWDYSVYVSSNNDQYEAINIELLVLILIGDTENETKD